MASPPSSPLIIRARAVAKRFGDFEALQSLDLDVHAGECVGLLGPNGAGKSTFIGCLYGVVARNCGELEVFGHDPAKSPRLIKERLGVVPQENALDEGLTVLENMQIYARFGGLSRKAALPRIQELLAHMALEHKQDATIKTLSGGMKRRLTFVRALLSDPELLILDEPTTGLDPTVRHLLWDKVLSFRQAGKTVLLTTHYMHEAELLCDRIVILNKGSVVGKGAPRELIEKEAPGFVGIFGEESESRLRPHLDKAWDIFHQGHQCCIRAPGLEDLVRLQQTAGILALQLRPSNLEDVYLKLTGRELDANE
ncbi:MAG: ABC transporter ATP-binding protein [Candidatus Methylacidiphilales bacterium]|nr:ABC transporter ATP-binding protein [Candidatus Methylacidiphilales bacterium]